MGRLEHSVSGPVHAGTLRCRVTAEKDEYHPPAFGIHPVDHGVGEAFPSPPRVGPRLARTDRKDRIEEEDAPLRPALEMTVGRDRGGGILVKLPEQVPE